MVTTFKPPWGNKLYEDDVQVSRRFPLRQRDPNIENINPNKATMKSLQESRQIFLQNLQNGSQNNLEIDEGRKKRKISFKTKNSGSTNRRATTTTLSASKVQQLTSKFNELIQEQPKMAKVIHRVNSSKPDQNKKPIIRPKPNKFEDKKRPLVKRKFSMKKPPENVTNNRASVKETIEIFERRKSELEKPKVPEKNVRKTKELVIKDGVRKFKLLSTEKSNLNLSELQNYFETQSQTEKKSSTKMYETLNITKTTSSVQVLKMAEEKTSNIKPNNSFLYRSKSKEFAAFNVYTSIDYEDLKNENLYDTVDAQNIDEYKLKYEELLAKTDEILKRQAKPEEATDSIDNISNHSYESFCHQNDYEYLDTSIEDPPKITEEIYELLSVPITQKPLPLIPVSSSNSSIENIYSTLPNTPVGNEDNQINEEMQKEEEIYEKISPRFNFDNLLTLNLGKTDDLSSCGSNRGSVLSCDQQSNSLYGRYAPESDHSSTGRSSNDDWVDLSDFEGEEETGFVIIREKQKLSKKTSGWSNKVRDQWTKSPKKVVVLEEDALSDSYHYYESLHSDDDFDSFDSESDDDSFTKINPNDSGVEMGLSQLPEPPRDGSIAGGNIYGLTRLAARLRKNWSLTKNDITKSLSRMTKKKNSGDSRGPVPPLRPPPPLPTSKPRPVSTPVLPKAPRNIEVDFELNQNVESTENIKTSASTNSMGRKKNWLKFRRAVSMGGPSFEEPALQIFNPTKSTFYLPNEPEVDLGEKPQVPARRRAPRPQSPPPPAPIGPPALGGPPIGKINKDKLRSTSWYAECGLFKPDHQTGSAEINGVSLIPQRSSSTCWYAEVGLYQPDGKKSISSCSSMENSGSSTTKDFKMNSNKPDLIPNSKFYTKDNPDDLEVYYNIRNSLKRQNNDQMATLLRDEPLYQFYDAAVADLALNESSSDSEYDGYEEIGELAKISEKNDEKIARTSVRTRVLGCRTLWCEIPEVIQSEILRTLTSNQRKLQEAKFEIITSEASYLNSLNILTAHFYPNLTKNDLLSEFDRKILFGNIFAVKKCSEGLLNDLENSWQESILLPNICSVIKNYCDKHFSVYIEYCASQTRSDAILKKYRGDTNPKNGKSPSSNRFAEVVKRLEASSECQGLSLHSFLMLPMQRVTRLPLLLDAVLRRLTPSDEEYSPCQEALRALHDLATRCNEAARHSERLSELERISEQLEYPGGVPRVDLVSEGCKRYLVRSGDLTQLLPRGGAKGDDQGMKLTFGKRFVKQMVTILLFEDYIIIARKKCEDILTVLHHCPRSFLELSTPENSPPTIDSALLLFITLLENQDGKQISMLLTCSSETEKTRWVEALRPPEAEDPNETVYESWDCPQVQAIHHYDSVQPDELNLQRGDVVNVDKKMKDGWFHGEKLRDGQLGWFPGNHAIEIANPHVRARNLRQRYRLLAYTDEFLNNSQNKT